MKMNAMTKVNLKINFSRPRLVKEVPPEAKPLLPKPVPLAWIRMRPIKTTEAII